MIAQLRAYRFSSSSPAEYFDPRVECGDRPTKATPVLELQLPRKYHVLNPNILCRKLLELIISIANLMDVDMYYQGFFLW